MTTLRADVKTVKIEALTLSEEILTVDLSDGRRVSVPLTWYPRLLHATEEERGHWHWIGSGEGIHWPDLDEDVSAENLVFGRPSGESQQSLQLWMESRNRTFRESSS
jgi:hypothetical protein